MARRVSIPLLQLLLVSTLMIGQSSACSQCFSGNCDLFSDCPCCDSSKTCVMTGIGGTGYCEPVRKREVKETAEPSDFLRKLLDQEAF